MANSNKPNNTPSKPVVTPAKVVEPVAAAVVTPVVPAVVVPKTEAQLMAEMQAAVTSGDFKMVAKVASELVKVQKDKAQSELDAKLKVLVGKTEAVKQAINEVITRMADAGELDAADGVWFSRDFTDNNLITCRLTKTYAKSSTPKTPGTASGAGKKFAVSTTDLLTTYGNEIYKDGATFQAAWDSNTDKNFRYAIREALLKKSGAIS